MAIIQCPGCGNPVSNQAVHCPKCGQPIAGGVNVQYNNTPAQPAIDNSPLEWYMWVVLLLTGWLVNLIYYFVKKDKAPVRAKQALICLVINVVCSILYFIFIGIAVEAASEMYVNDYYYY